MVFFLYDMSFIESNTYQYRHVIAQYLVGLYLSKPGTLSLDFKEMNKQILLQTKDDS